MEENPTSIWELLVGLGDVEVLGVDDEPAGPLAVHVRTRRRPACGGGGEAVVRIGGHHAHPCEAPVAQRAHELLPGAFAMLISSRQTQTAD